MTFSETKSRVQSARKSITGAMQLKQVTDQPSFDAAYTLIGKLIVLQNMLEAGLARLLTETGGFGQSSAALQAMGAIGFQQQCTLLMSFAGKYPTEKNDLKRVTTLIQKIGTVRNHIAHGIVGDGPKGKVIVHVLGTKALGSASEKVITLDEAREAMKAFDPLHHLTNELCERFSKAHAWARLERVLRPGGGDLDALVNEALDTLRRGRPLVNSVYGDAPTSHALI